MTRLAIMAAAIVLVAGCGQQSFEQDRAERARQFAQQLQDDFGLDPAELCERLNLFESETNLSVSVEPDAAADAIAAIEDAVRAIDGDARFLTAEDTFAEVRELFPDAPETFDPETMLAGFRLLVDEARIDDLIDELGSLPGVRDAIDARPTEADEQFRIAVCEAGG